MPKFCYDRRLVRQSLLVSSTHLGITTRFVLLPDGCRFVDVGGCLWQGDGSVVYNCCWSSLAQLFLGPSPAGLVAFGFGDPCGGGVQYLHRGPASRRKRLKRKSQIWDSKIRSRVLRDSDPRKTTLARTSSIYKIQIRPLVREGVPQKQDRKCKE
jgi:hypothetical protein